ncbi:hypothetical protein [Kitasatospora sp. GAS204B]|uniref:hypothetical protein n=1 Tax=unclassified Kitasatospora TaxID=2633591 RepID=UPI0024770065|nr:hypothetical protein [Kitasatospora sp. GAS204B]MDH6119295.1 hypothetical protein [Kitasatospora sp. GAS204B]
MTHNDVARVLAPRALAARPLTRPLACECPDRSADLAVRPLVRAPQARELTRPFRS